MDRSCKFVEDQVAAAVLDGFLCILCSSLLLQYIGDELCGRLYAFMPLCLYALSFMPHESSYVDCIVMELNPRSRLKRWRRSLSDPFRQNYKMVPNL